MSKAGIDFYGQKKRVRKPDAQRQQRTLSAIMAKLSRQPGVILADEVGMGKTYVALGAVAEYLIRYPRSRVLILTPSRELAEKWTQDFRRFREENVSVAAGRCLTSPADLYQRPLSAIMGDRSKSRVWILPISTLLNDGARDPHIQREQRVLIYQMLGNAAGLGSSDHLESRKRLWKMLGGSPRKMPHQRKRLRWHGRLVGGHRYTVRELIGVEGLQKLCDGDFSGRNVMIWREKIRWHLIGDRLRRFSLIVLDEAHHLRNPNTKRYRVLENVFERKFRDVLFLTATPFQLGPEELEHVLKLFRLSTEPGGMSVPAEAEALTEKTSNYQSHVRRFEMAWHQLDDNAKNKIVTLVDRCGRALSLKPLESDTRTCEFVETLIGLRRSHKEVTTALSKWVIRNVKERPYRDTVDLPIELTDDDKIPFALLYRLIHEYQQRQRTFSSVQQLSLTSSWGALSKSAVMRGRVRKSPPVKFYRRLLRSLNTKKRSENHPKIAALIDQVVQTYKQGEKTLVFTSRIETVKTLQRLLNARLEEVAHAEISMLKREDIERGLRSIGKRITTVRDLLWLRFQENRFRVFLKKQPDLEALYRDAIRFLSIVGNQHCLGPRGKGRGPDWRLLRDLCEWLVFDRGNGVAYEKDNPVTKYWRRGWGILQMDFRKRYWLRFSADIEDEVLNYHRCTSEELRSWIRTVLNVKSVWEAYGPTLKNMNYELKDKLLDATRSALMVPEEMGQAVAAMGRHPGRTERAIVKAFCRPSVMNKIRRFFEFMRGLPEPEVEQFVKGLKTVNMVARASGEESTAARMRYRYGFNTPFRPYVLVASDVMQEGLDLHRECSRVIHYDLAWNPAVLEQRVGRIDRLGSKTDRELSKGTRLQIDRRYLPGTIDERMFLRVRERERWFKLILGNRPEWNEDSEDPASAIRLPERFSDEFQIRLEP
jgi:superfamily II DNA or RNA helicase